MKNRNVFWGIVFILAAVFLLLSNFGFFHNINVFKLLLATALVYVIAQNLPRRNYYGILIPAALICILYDDFLHINSITPFPLLAASIFASIGLFFLFPGEPPFKERVSFHTDAKPGGYFNEPCIHCSAAFTSATKYINTANFQQAYLKCTFGCLKVYFDQTQIPDKTAEIYIDNSFGDTSLFLPKEWNVHLDINTTFGDIREIHKPPVAPADAPAVSVRGSVNFGDCKIYYI